MATKTPTKPKPKTGPAASPDEPLLQWIPLDRLDPHPDNVRARLGDLDELTKSIDSKGILEPLLVLPAVEGRHLVVAGHRRLAAAVKSKAKAPAPCVVRDLNEAEVIEAMLVENLQRAALTPVEEAKAYARLVDLEVTVRDIARKVGRSEPTVRARLDLVALPDRVLDWIEAGTVSLAEAADLARWADDDETMAWVCEQRTAPNKWAVERHVTGREHAAALDAERAKLTAAGITEHTPDARWWMPPWKLALNKPCEVRQLGLGRDGSKHRLEPCHAVHLSVDGGPGEVKVTRTTICTSPGRHSTHGPAKDRSDLQSPAETWAHLDTDRDLPDSGLAAERKAAADASAARRAWFADRLNGGGGMPALPSLAIVAVLHQFFSTTAYSEGAEDVTDLLPDTWPPAAADDNTAALEAAIFDTVTDPHLHAERAFELAWALLITGVEDAGPTSVYDGEPGFWAWYGWAVDAGYQPTSWETERHARWAAGQAARRVASATVDVDALELDPDTLDTLREFATAAASELLLPASAPALADLEAREYATSTVDETEGSTYRRVKLTAAGQRVVDAIAATPTEAAAS